MAVGGFMSDETKSLGTALPAEMARVRDEVLPAYREIGPAGAFAVAWMTAALNDATHAMMEGDVVRMLEAYQKLKGATT
jgi:hypothetical protein